MAILRGQAADGARTAGRFAFTLGKVLAIVALAAGGLTAIGAARSRTRDYANLDHSFERVRRLNEATLRSLREMPKLDLDAYRNLHRPALQLDFERPALEGGASPSQATATSPR